MGEDIQSNLRLEKCKKLCTEGTGSAGGREGFLTDAGAPVGVQPKSLPALALEGSLGVGTALLAAPVQHLTLIHICRRKGEGEEGSQESPDPGSPARLIHNAEKSIKPGWVVVVVCFILAAKKSGILWCFSKFLQAMPLQSLLLKSLLIRVICDTALSLRPREKYREELGLDNTSEPVGTAGPTFGFYKNLLYEHFLLHQAFNPICSCGYKQVPPT